MVFTSNLETFVTVFYERFRKVCPQCNTIVHVKKSVCDRGHAFASKKRKPAVWEPENAMKRRKTLLSEEVISDKRERQTPQSK